MSNKTNRLFEMVRNCINIFCITIENIINIIIIVSIFIVILYISVKNTGYQSCWSTVIIGVLSGITASILIQSAIDLRECKKDAFKLRSLWTEYYYSEYGTPIFNTYSKKNDIISHVNSKYKIISEINNILSNKYSFELFECNVDKAINKFIRQMEDTLGPYRNDLDGALYAYAVFSGITVDTYERNNETYSYIQAIGNIIWASMNTHMPICRKHFIYKKSGITNKKDFNTIIEYIEHMNKNILCGKYEAEKRAYHKSLNRINSELSIIWKNI